MAMTNMKLLLSFLCGLAVTVCVLTGCNIKPSKDKAAMGNILPDSENLDALTEKYSEAFAYYRERHLDFDDWDVSVAIDSVHRYFDTTYHDLTPLSGISIRQLREGK